ncbi:MAG: hypothetical protein AABY22_26615, partial [Nanoarchaeota archaeon]
HDCKEHKWVYSKEEVVECRDYWIKELDNYEQKVRDAIKKLREDTKDNFQMMTSDAGARIKIVQLNNALCYIEEIEKELGL